MPHNSRRMRISEALRVNIRDLAFEEQASNRLAVYDIQTFIGKAVYGEHFGTSVLSVSERIKHLNGWQSTRRHLIKTVFEQMEDIDISEKITQQFQTKSILNQADKQDHKIEESTTTAAPQYIRAMLSLTNGENVTLGPNGTKVRADVLAKINWNLSNANIVRKLLMELFDRKTLATHSLSGKPSPAFMGCNKPIKMQLDPLIVHDIIYILTNSLDMTEKDVRQAITTKCADENKMHRQREEKRHGIVKKISRTVHKVKLASG